MSDEKFTPDIGWIRSILYNMKPSEIDATADLIHATIKDGNIKLRARVAELRENLDDMLYATDGSESLIAPHVQIWVKAKKALAKTQEATDGKAE